MAFPGSSSQFDLPPIYPLVLAKTQLPPFPQIGGCISNCVSSLRKFAT
ncbi:MAG: hypothetical protein ACTS4T_00905 [Candidatus Hodgkinia cicadicola]